MNLISYIKKVIPLSFKQLVKKYLFIKKYGFSPPPPFSDMSGYELLLDTILYQKIYQLEGDFVEIGVFLGGGTYKLSKLLEKLASEKRIYAIDIFDPNFDKSACTRGLSMSDLYERILGDRNQHEIYKAITKNCDNIITIAKDSMKVSLPCQNISFAYIDGNHSPQYVRNDFYLVWNKLVSNGIIAFDDYGFDLPQVTKTIHELISENREEIKRIFTSGLKTIFIQKE